LAIDLFCGLGGWAEGFLSEGYDVIGFDIERRPYPGQLVLQDVLTLHGSQFRNAAVIVASPPCQEFSRWDIPQTRARNPPAPDLKLALACRRIALEASVPIVIENVRGSLPWLQPHLGPARRYGSFWLYGDVPAILPQAWALGAKGKKRRGSDVLRPGEYKGKELMSHVPHLRAKIPFPLAQHIARVFKPDNPQRAETPVQRETERIEASA